jgi:hypothetical protein
MQGLESYIMGNVWQFIGFGIIIIANLYIANKVNPIKKTVEKLEASDLRKWDVIEAVKKQLDILQGEHNVNACKGGKKK